MKRFFATLMIAALICAAGCCAQAEFLIMGVDAQYPPYTYLNEDGDFVGFDAEMCMACCEVLGWDLEIVPISWETKLIQLDDGDVDCVWSGLTIDVIDPEAYTLSFPYSDNSLMVLTKAANGIAELSDLAGKTVGVQLGTSADLLLQTGKADLAATFADLQRLDNYNLCFDELMADHIDAIAIDIGIASEKIAEYGDEYVLLDETLASEKYGICFRKEDTEMCASIEEAYMWLVENGTYKALAQKYGLDLTSLCLLNE